MSLGGLGLRGRMWLLMMGLAGFGGGMSGMRRGFRGGCGLEVGGGVGDSSSSM